MPLVDTKYTDTDTGMLLLVLVSETFVRMPLWTTNTKLTDSFVFIYWSLLRYYNIKGVVKGSEFRLSTTLLTKYDLTFWLVKCPFFRLFLITLKGPPAELLDNQAVFVCFLQQNILHVSAQLIFFVAVESKNGNCNLIGAWNCKTNL